MAIATNDLIARHVSPGEGVTAVIPQASRDGWKSLGFPLFFVPFSLGETGLKKL